MHAYLILGKDSTEIDKEIEKISAEKKAKITIHSLQKIEDVRNLGKITRLTLTDPEIYVLKDIETASEETLNAFLKNLEEPQENLTYILTSRSIHQVLPTIASRCQIILTKDNDQSSNQESQDFLNLSLGDKLKFVDKIKDREAAVEFLEEFSQNLHLLIHSNKGNLDTLAGDSEVTLETLKKIKANGNVSLQLANFVLSLV